MSFGSARFRSQQQACRRFEQLHQQLVLELAMGAARRYIGNLTELLGLLLDQAGGTLEADALRQRLAETKRAIAGRENRARAVDS